MARVEITQNKGPEVIDSWSGQTSSTDADNYGDIVNVRLYTLHSYQVIFSAGGSNVTFEVLGSNYFDTSEPKKPSLDFENDWTVIHSESIKAGDNIAYCDVWNFKYACIRFTGGASGSDIKVFEKHNV